MKKQFDIGTVVRNISRDLGALALVAGAYGCSSATYAPGNTERTSVDCVPINVLFDRFDCRDDEAAVHYFIVDRSWVDKLKDSAPFVDSPYQRDIRPILEDAMEQGTPVRVFANCDKKGCNPNQVLYGENFRNMIEF